MAKGDFIADRALYLDQDDNLVEADSPEKLTKLADVGTRVSEADVVKYGLREQPSAEPQILARAEVRESVGFKAEPESVVELEPEPAVEPELKGKLPSDFPGHAALAKAGINTYGQLAKVQDLTTIPGIAEPTAAKIAEARKGEN